MAAGSPLNSSTLAFFPAAYPRLVAGRLLRFALKALAIRGAAPRSRKRKKSL